MAATLTLRSVKGSPLTNNEVDGNFTALNTEIGTLESDMTTAQSDISTLQTDLDTLEASVGATNLSETIQDIIGSMVTGNTENGIAVTYQDADGTLDFDVGDFTITLGGDLTGSATVTNLGSVTLTAAVVDDSHSHVTSNIDGFDAAVRTEIEGADLDLGTNKILFSNVYSTTGDLPSASSYHGMFAHVHGEGAAYFAHSGNWVQLAKQNQSPTVTLTGAVTGSGTMTNLGNVSISTTATADPTLTLTGDVSGSATFTNLGNATLTATVANDSHSHSNYIASNANDTATGVITFSNTTAATSATTGAVKISGGLGVGGAIYAAGDVTAYSDDRLKTNVHEIENGLDKVMALRGITFERIADGSISTGVSAQDVHAVLPEAVSTDEEGLMAVKYGNLVGLLIEAIKDLKEEVNELKAEKGNTLH